MSKQEVINVLKIDNINRQPNNYENESDLWLLNEIDFTKDWDYSLPTIYSESINYSGSRADLRNTMLKHSDHFNAIFWKNYSKFFSKVKTENILIAGGCVIGTLLQSKWDNDIDIFIYGLNQEEANNKINQLVEEIYASYQDYLLSEHFKQMRKEGTILEDIKPEELLYMLSDKLDITNVRNKHCLTLQFGFGEKIQIIFRLYRSISEILHGFDLGSSAIGYDGKNIYFTSLGKFAYEYLSNIVDTSRRSTTYEKRLMKYQSRGFQIILPNLDINKLRREYFQYNMVEVCKLPYFVFSYRNIKGNKIYFDKLLEWGIIVNKPDEEKPDSDYQLSDIDEYKVFYLNLKNLVNNSDNYYYYSSRMNQDILVDPPYITSSRIIDFYDSIEKRIYNKSKFNAKIVTTYFSNELLPNILTEIFVKKNYKYLKEIIQQQKQLILKRFHKMNNLDHSKINWVTKNPGTQLTGSFNPIIADEKDWYGKYYLPNPFEKTQKKLRRPQ